MSYSLNEVEATAKRAARGAGLSWGMAEEASKAARWLCMQDLPGCKILSAALLLNDGTTLAERAPIRLTGTWASTSGSLCPILTGACLSDCASLLKNSEITLQSVNHPLLLAHFVGASARLLSMQDPQHSRVTVSAQWAGASVTSDGYQLCVTGPQTELHATKADGVTIRLGGEITTPQPLQNRASPNPEDWQAFLNFAQRTYAPATEESRLLGAGAGVNDND
jgi:hypothetical protein